MKDIVDEIIDDMFDAGWKAFVEELRRKNRRSNDRLYRLLEVIKGKRCVLDLQKLLTATNEDYQIRVVRKSVGMLFGDKRWKSFPELYINQRTNGDGGISGTVCVQVKEKRWLIIHYKT